MHCIIACNICIVRNKLTYLQHFEDGCPIYHMMQILKDWACFSIPRLFFKSHTRPNIWSLPVHLIFFDVSVYWICVTYSWQCEIFWVFSFQIGVCKQVITDNLDASMKFRIRHCFSDINVLCRRIDYLVQHICQVTDEHSVRENYHVTGYSLIIMLRMTVN